MTQCIQNYGVSKYRRRRQDKYLRQAEKLNRMRAEKKRKREELIADGWRPEPKMERAYRFEIGIRNKATGETHWRT